ncbi:hypothetical protein AA23498_2596 [Acetobacter nitrogenifigens DSM 23921 = NBRC 105050]|nr:hypothetical protein AA23498_2596 [Acetobacter nitrogenifigens DSM 23921 = NBRC 105050]
MLNRSPCPAPIVYQAWHCARFGGALELRSQPVARETTQPCMPRHATAPRGHAPRTDQFVFAVVHDGNLRSIVIAVANQKTRPSAPLTRCERGAQGVRIVRRDASDRPARRLDPVDRKV